MFHFALLTMSMVACGSNGLPVRTLTLEGQEIRAEIAATPEARSRGLMFRDAMGKDQGMLFIYPDEKPRAFWMKDTRLPLSIAFADHTGKVVRIADMKPFDTNRTPSLYPATYALEMNVGWFETHGIEKGDVIGGLPKDIEVK